MEQTFMQTFGIWLGAFLTLGIYSFLYKDNPLYKLCEAIFVGISAGYIFVQDWWRRLVPDVWEKVIWPPEGSHYQLWPGLLATILGIMILFRISRKYNWIARYPITFMVGWGSGLSIVRMLNSYIYKQIESTIVPLTDINAIILAVGVITGLIYFFFSLEHKGIIGSSAKVGIYFLMIAFGASFGYTVMARISLLIGRLDFLMFTWLKLPMG